MKQIYQITQINRTTSQIITAYQRPFVAFHDRDQRAIKGPGSSVCHGKKVESPRGRKNRNQNFQIQKLKTINSAAGIFYSNLVGFKIQLTGTSLQQT